MRRAADTKNRYQQMIRTYTERREKYRSNPELKENIRAINRKLTTWRRAIRRIETRHQKMKQIAYRLEEFYGVDVRGSIKSDRQIARQLFIKYCLENGLQSPDIMHFLGSRRKYWATHARRNFTRSFQTKPENRELWNRFLNYMKEQI